MDNNRYVNSVQPLAQSKLGLQGLRIYINVVNSVLVGVVDG
jgi:hypothetical protein